MAFSTRSRSSMRVGRMWTESKRMPLREGGIQAGADFRPQLDRWASMRERGFLDCPTYTTTPSRSRAYTAGFSITETSTNPSSTGAILHFHNQLYPHNQHNVKPLRFMCLCFRYVCFNFYTQDFRTVWPTARDKILAPPPPGDGCRRSEAKGEG